MQNTSAFENRCTGKIKTKHGIREAELPENERLNLQPIKLNSATADRIAGFPLIGCNFKSLVDI